MIEHNLEVIKTADWIIDMGPEGGDGGGKVVAAGTPEDVAKVEASYTGRWLKGVLGRRPADAPKSPDAAAPPRKEKAPNGTGRNGKRVGVG